jgi:hypothetical protein
VTTERGQARAFLAENKLRETSGKGECKAALEWCQCHKLRNTCVLFARDLGTDHGVGIQTEVQKQERKGKERVID